MTSRPILRPLAALSVTFLAGALHAQTSASSTDSSPATGEATAVAPTTALNEPPETDWRFVGQLTGAATYDDNVFIQRSDRRHDVYYRIAPTFAYGIGAFRTDLLPFTPIPHLLALTGEENLLRKDYAYVSYTPEAVLFSKYHQENALNHDLRLAAREERDLWTAQGRFEFQHVLDTNIDVGARIHQTYYTFDGSASHALSGRTNASVAVEANRTEYSGGFASTDARVGGAVDYQLAPKTSVGLGVRVGHLNANQSASQTYEQPELQVSYNPTGKISLTGRAGTEFRQYHSDIPNRSRFIYSLGVGYEPSDGTSASLTAARDTVGSAQYAAENIVADSVQGQVRQRLLTRIYATLSGGYVRNRYENNRSFATLTRRDEYYFGKISAARDITRHGTIELSYEHRENDSTVHPFGFTQNLASLSASFMY